MKIIEKWGTGIPRILRECKEYGLKKPELIDFDGDFRVNMYRREEKSKNYPNYYPNYDKINQKMITKFYK